MKKIFDYFKKHSDLIGYICLGLFFVYMMIQIYPRLYYSMESDMSSELVLAKLLASEKAIISKNWYYSTEIRVLNTNLIFMPLFLITDDWFTVRMVGMGILIIILFLSYLYLAKQLNMKHIPWLAFMIIGAISKDYYKVVLLDSCYIPHIVISFLSMGLIISVHKQEDKTKRIIKTIILLLLAFGAGLEGARLVFLTYMPVVVAALMYYFFNQLDNLKEGKFELDEKYIRLIVITIITFVAGFIGALVNSKVLRNLGYSFQSGGLEIFYAPFSFERLATVINGWLSALGYQADGLFAFIPIQIIIKPLFILFFLIFNYALINMIMKYKKYEKYEKFILIYFVVASLIISLLFIFTDTWYRDRYLLPISVYSVFIIGIFLSKYKIDWQKYLMLMLVVLFLFINTRFQIHYRSDVNPYRIMPEIKDILIKNNCFNGYSVDHWSGNNILTELSNGQIETWVFRNSNIDDISVWLQSKEHRNRHATGKVYLFLTQEDYEEISFKEDVSKYIYYEDDYRTLYIFSSYDQLKQLMVKVSN